MPLIKVINRVAYLFVVCLNDLGIDIGENQWFVLFNVILWYNGRVPGCGAVGSARLLGSRGRWFKSSHPDHFL